MLEQENMFDKDEEKSTNKNRIELKSRTALIATGLVVFMAVGGAAAHFINVDKREKSYKAPIKRVTNYMEFHGGGNSLQDHLTDEFAKQSRDKYYSSLPNDIVIEIDKRAKGIEQYYLDNGYDNYVISEASELTAIFAAEEAKQKVKMAAETGNVLTSEELNNVIDSAIDTAKDEIDNDAYAPGNNYFLNFKTETAERHLKNKLVEDGVNVKEIDVDYKTGSPIVK